MSEEQIHPVDPFTLLASWLPPNEDAARPLMTVATIDESGLPDARSLLLSEWDADGFSFHTDAASRKVAQLRNNPTVALCIPLLGIPSPDCRHQLVVQGTAEPAERAAQERAYAARPPYLQQLAWQNTAAFASLPQDQRIQAWADFSAAHPDGFEPAPGWTGFLVRAHRLTFWFGSESTASRRVEYTLVDGSWEWRILAG